MAMGRVTILLWVIIVIVFALALLCGCAALPLLGSSVSLYKSAKESGPKLEIVIIKFAPETHTYYVNRPTPTPRPWYRK